MRKISMEQIKHKCRKTKLLAIVITGLVLAACSNDKAEQKKQSVEETNVPVIKQAKKVDQQIDKRVNQLETKTLSDDSEQVSTEITTNSEDIIVVDKPVEQVEVESTTEPEKDQSVKGAEASEPQNHVVKAAVTKFQPMVLFVKPGDTITWENMAGHDTTSLEGMIPEGAESWHSKMGEQFSITLGKEGAYVYKCTPHASLGMLGAIIVGDGKPGNLDKIINHPDNKGMVKRTIRKMTEALDKHQ